MSKQPVYPRLPATQQHELLQRIVARSAHDPVRDRGKPTPFVCFALDGTLFDNRPRTAAILKELAETWRSSHPDVAAKLAGGKAEQMAYLLTDTLERLGILDTARVAEA